MIKKEYNKRKIGTYYEDIAIKYLQDEGYKILDRNYHAGRYGELDIVAKDKENILIICECKYRTDNTYGDPLSVVDFRKQKQICKTTLFYLMKKGYGYNVPCRFDVIAIYGDQKIKHIKNAFDFQY